MSDAYETDDEADPFDEYAVVRNLHGDYSIWPVPKAIPEGWASVGVRGSQAQCLDWIEANWTGPVIN